MKWYYQHLLSICPTKEIYIQDYLNRREQLIKTIWYFPRKTDKQLSTDYYYIKEYISNPNND